MKTQLFTAAATLCALMQIGCSSNKDQEMQAFWAKCRQSQACIDQYTNAAKAVAIAGTAAVAGLPQVATPGAPVLPGQVPSTSLLPANVSDKDIKAQAAKVAAELKTWNTISAPVTAPPPSVSAATPMSVGVSSTAGNLQQVDIGVTRLPDNEPAARTPASAAAPADALDLVSGGGSNPGAAR